MEWTVKQPPNLLESFLSNTEISSKQAVSNLHVLDHQKKVTEQQLNCCTYLALLICGDVYGFRLMSERLSKIVVWGGNDKQSECFCGLLRTQCFLPMTARRGSEGPCWSLQILNLGIHYQLISVAVIPLSSSCRCFRRKQNNLPLIFIKELQRKSASDFRSDRGRPQGLYLLCFGICLLTSENAQCHCKWWVMCKAKVVRKCRVVCSLSYKLFRWVSSIFYYLPTNSFLPSSYKPLGVRNISFLCSLGMIFFLSFLQLMLGSCGSAADCPAYGLI